jgi:hypothetical protein
MGDRRKSQVNRSGNPKKIQPVDFGDEVYSYNDKSMNQFMELPVVAAVVASNPPIRDHFSKNQYEDEEDQNLPQDEFVEKPQPERRRSFGQISMNSNSNNAGRRGSTAGNGQPRRNSLPPELSREVSLLSTNIPNPKAWPPGLRKKIIEGCKKKVNEAKGREFLSRYHWPEGLKQTIIKSCKKLPLRFFIVDDSGSMLTNDGRRLLNQGNSAK